MLIETLQYLERLRSIDSDLTGRQLGGFHETLAARQWIKAVGKLTHVEIECFADSTLEAEVIESDDKVYWFHSPECHSRIMTRPVAEIVRYRFQMDAFLDDLAELLGPRFKTRRSCLVPDHLWCLGDLQIGNDHAFAPVFFGRCLKRAPGEALQEKLADPAFVSGGVLLALFDPGLALPNGHRVRQVSDLVVVENDNEQFNLEWLDRILVAQHPPKKQPEIIVECAPDGSWLRVGERELRKIRGQQQDFVVTMVEAYHKGNRRPKIEWAFRLAGYGEGTYDLRHISRRPEFLEFFAQEGGECWIVTQP